MSTTLYVVRVSQALSLTSRNVINDRRVNERFSTEQQNRRSSKGLTVSLKLRFLRMHRIH